MKKSEYWRIFNNLNEKEKRIFENNVHKDVLNLLENADSIMEKYIGQAERKFSGEELNSDEFKNYIVSEKISIAVKEVVIESSRLEKMPNAIIYDVPGFDSPTKMHGEQTKEHMKQADAIILIASAGKPSFTAPALDMFNEVVDDDNTMLSDKLFVFGNKADAATTLEKNIETIKSEIEKYHLMSSQDYGNRLVIGSAKAHLQAKGKMEGTDCKDEVDSPKYKKVIDYGDGIDHIYDKLKEYNENERFRILVRKVKKNNQEISDIFNDLKEKYKDSGKISNEDMKDVQKRLSELRRHATGELKTFFGRAKRKDS